MRALVGPLAAGWMMAADAVAQDRVVAYRIVNGETIPASLTGTPGNAEAGRTLYFDRDRTACSVCHGSPGGPGAETLDGTSAPALNGIGARMAEGTIRLWLVAPQVLNPETVMPPYYGLGQRDDPQDPRFGEPLLTAAEIEDLVAYLMQSSP